MTEDDRIEGRDAGARESAEPDRRRFLTWLSTAVMAGGLVAAYGSLAALVGRFLYPSRPTRRSWLFVREAARIAPGGSLPFKLPNGSPVHITRRDSGDGSEQFRALSSTCPHLGCQVHWEAHNERFFCPCHNGVFSPDGQAIAGPPADAGQALLQFPVKVEGGLLYIEAPADQLASATGATAAAGAASPCRPSSASTHRGRRA